MDRARRAELLKLVRVGHDTEAAAAKLDISMAEVRKGGEKLRRELDDAFATASARLRAKLLEGALDGNDLKLLSGILEQRKIAQQAATAENGINKIGALEASTPPSSTSTEQTIADEGRAELVGLLASMTSRLAEVYV